MRTVDLSTAKQGSPVVGTAILLAFFVSMLALMIYAIRAIDTSYDSFGSLLDRSVRLVLRGEESGAQLENLMVSVFSFIDRMARVNARADMRREGEELKSLWADRHFSAPLQPPDRDRLIATIERLESLLVQQRRSLRLSFDALFAAISIALVASLTWSASLWHRFRVKSVEAEWTQKSMKRALYAEEETRKRIARDLHDDAIQDIAAARMLCDRMSTATDMVATQGLAANAAGILTETGKKLRILVHDIRPPTLERSGLVPALESLCARNEALFGKEIHFVAADLLPRLTDDAMLQAYRIVQEALTNSIKHAPRNRIELRLEPASHGGRRGMLIRVEDMPANITHAASPSSAMVPKTSDWGGLGMAIMRERAWFVGGQVDLKRSDGGLAVLIFVPADGREDGIHA